MGLPGSQSLLSVTPHPDSVAARTPQCRANTSTLGQRLGSPHWEAGRKLPGAAPARGTCWAGWALPTFSPSNGILPLPQSCPASPGMVPGGSGAPLRVMEPLTASLEGGWVPGVIGPVWARRFLGSSFDGAKNQGSGSALERAGGWRHCQGKTSKGPRGDAAILTAGSWLRWAVVLSWEAAESTTLPSKLLGTPLSSPTPTQQALQTMPPGPLPAPASQNLQKSQEKAPSLTGEHQPTLSPALPGPSWRGGAHRRVPSHTTLLTEVDLNRLPCLFLFICF